MKLFSTQISLLLAYALVILPGCQPKQTSHVSNSELSKMQTTLDKRKSMIEKHLKSKGKEHVAEAEKKLSAHEKAKNIIYTKFDGSHLDSDLSRARVKYLFNPERYLVQFRDSKKKPMFALNITKPKSLQKGKLAKVSVAFIDINEKGVFQSLSKKAGPTLELRNSEFSIHENVEKDTQLSRKFDRFADKLRTTVEERLKSYKSAEATPKFLKSIENFLFPKAYAEEEPLLSNLEIIIMVGTVAGIALLYFVPKILNFLITIALIVAVVGIIIYIAVKAVNRSKLAKYLRDDIINYPIEPVRPGSKRPVQ